MSLQKVDRINQDIRILVTGATGFVGDAIMRRGQNLIGFRFSGLARTPAVVNVSPYDVNICDVTDAVMLNKLVPTERFDTIVHTAGLAHQFNGTPAAEFQRVNVGGTQNICRFAIGVGARRLVLISSVSVYGNYDAELVDETFECHPVGPYAESKYEAEIKASEMCSANGIELIILRPATVIGAGDRGNTARLVAAIDGRRFVWIGDGRNRKTLIDRDDLATAVVLAATSVKQTNLGTFNVSAPPVAMRDIVETIASVCGKRILPVKVPVGLALAGARFLGKIRGAEIGSRYASTIMKWLSEDVYDGRKFTDTYDWHPDVPIKDSLRGQVESYLAEKKTTSAK